MANCVQVDNHKDLFGRHPNDSVEVISNEDIALDQSGNLPQGLTVCHVALELSADEDNYCLDNESRPQPSLKTRSMKPPIPMRLYQNRFGRIRAKDGATQEHVHRRICLSQYMSFSASSPTDSVPTYRLLISQ